MTRSARFLGCDRGATAIEYALVAGMISIVIVAAVTQIGHNLISLFYNNLTNAF